MIIRQESKYDGGNVSASLQNIPDQPTFMKENLTENLKNSKFVKNHCDEASVINIFVMNLQAWRKI